MASTLFLGEREREGGRDLDLLTLFVVRDCVGFRLFFNVNF